MNLSRLVGTLALAAGAVLAAGALPASATTLKVLHSFCHDPGCVDGNNPSGTLLMDTSHNLYGTTELGGRSNAGAVFKMTFDEDTSHYFYHAIYHFCAATGCVDGGHPVNNRLILDKDGRIFGTASTGGQTPNGVVFMLVPNAAHTRYTQRVIYNFCAKFSDCSDGAAPVGGLTYAGQSSGQPYDGVSPLYGITRSGGRRNVGVVYSLTPNLNGTWAQRTLYFFCAKGGAGICSDGALPNPGIVLDKNGNLIGTTEQGGLDNAGLVYKLVPTQQGKWAETLLYQFCLADGCADGMTPKNGVVLDAVGNVYGTATAGGRAERRCGDSGCGVVFKISTNGTESTLYSFCQQTKCADGYAPAGIMMDSFGNIFGTTNGGGADKHGAIYELNATYVLLGSVKCKKSGGCQQGETFTGAPIEAPAGDLFFPLYHGGRYEGGEGTIIQFTP